MIFPDAVTQPILLLRLDAMQCHLWQAALASQLRHCSATNAETLLQAFAERLLPAENIFVSFENPTTLVEILAAHLPNIRVIPWQNEYTQIADLLKQHEHLALFDGIYPLFDVATTQTLYLIHEEYLADFSFGENFPPGIAPVFFSKMLLESAAMQELSQVLPQQHSLVNYLRQNINQFHVEIHYEEPDLRLLRLDFSCRNERSLARTARFLPLIEKSEPILLQIESLLNQKPELVFFLPSYLEVEIYSGCEFSCTFCPRQYSEQPTHEMPEEYLNKILQFIDAGAGDITVTLGGMGEPLQHPRAAEFLSRLLSAPRLAQVIIETNGRWLEKIFSIIEHPSFEKLRVIVNLNSLKRYEELHGVTAEVKAATLKAIAEWNTLVKAKGFAPEKTTWMQTLKILDNEDEIDELYDFCERGGMSFLFQKYNRFAGLMPEKRVSDMTPLERSFCWHLRRDMFIRADGRVAFCKQDVTGIKTRGHLAQDSLLDIWRSQLPDWRDNYQNRLAKLPDCTVCDEYFTFNA